MSSQDTLPRLAGVVLFGGMISVIALFGSPKSHSSDVPASNIPQTSPVEQPDVFIHPDCELDIDTSDTRPRLEMLQQFTIQKAATGQYPNVESGIAHSPRTLRANSPEEIERVNIHMDSHEFGTFEESTSQMELLTCAHLCFKEQQFRSCITWCNDMYPADSKELAQRIP